MLTFGLAANAQTVWSENFESATEGSMPTGWTLYEDNLTNYSSYASLGKSWTVVTLTNGGKCALSVSYTTVAQDCDRWMITPAISITDTNIALLADICGYSTSYPEKVRILVSTTGVEKTDFTQVLDVVMDGSTYGADWNTVLVPLSAYAGENIHIAFVNHADGYYTLVDNIEVKVVPDASIAVENVKAPSFIAMGENFNLDVTVKNFAGKNLNSFDISYTVNGGAAQTVNVTGVNVAPYTTYTKSISMNHSVDEALNIEVTISNPNGQTDPDAADNTGSTTVSVFNPANTYSRGNTLLEHFTTQVCQYCPGGHDRLGQAVNGGFADRVSWVAHHAGYYTDDMTIPASSSDIIRMYGNGGTWAPAMMLDRNCSFFPDEEGAVGSVGDVNAISSLLTQALAQPALVSLNIDNVSYNQSTREFSITVSGNSIIDLADGRISLYITEDSIIASQQSTGGQTFQSYQHDHVLRAVANDAWGDDLPLTKGMNFTKTLTYTLPATWKADKCRAIVFVNRYGNTIEERHVMNTVKTQYFTSPNLSIENVEATMTIKTWPNPVAETAYIDAESTIHNFIVVNAMGQKVMGGDVNTDVLELDVRNLAAGVYFVTVTTDNGTASQRLSVVK